MRVRDRKVSLPLFGSYTLNGQQCYFLRQEQWMILPVCSKYGYSFPCIAWFLFLILLMGLLYARMI